MAKKILLTLALLLIPLVAVNWSRLVGLIKTQITRIEKITPVTLTEQEVFDRINAYRTANKMIALKRNDKLDKAALSRLLVIKNNQDYSGAVTGLSLENAVKNNSYNFSSTGEIDTDVVTGETNLAEEWAKNEQQKKKIGRAHV